MNKIFWFLVVLCFVSAGALWWLLRHGPNPSDPHFAAEVKAESVAKVSESAEESAAAKDEAKEKEESPSHGDGHNGEDHGERHGEEHAMDHTDNHREEAAKADSEKQTESHAESHPQKTKKVAKEGPEAPPEISVDTLVGKRGPFFVQLGSFPVEEWLRGNIHLSAFEGALACKVNIAGKGPSVRILLGPYQNKKSAASAKRARTELPKDAFITGEQICLQ